MFALHGRMLLTVLAVIACFGCSENKPAAPPAPNAKLQPAAGWLMRHYKNNPPGKGWKIAAVTSQGPQVQVMVDIPAEQASALMRKPANDQFREVAGEVCPPQHEDLRALLPAGTGVQVLPAVKGQVFIEVACVM